MLKTNPNQRYASYFDEPASPTHKRYLALRMFFSDGCTAERVASETGYSVSTVYSMVRDFKEDFDHAADDVFFKDYRTGRKPVGHSEEVQEAVINLRKKYFSVPDIQVALDAMGIRLSIYMIEKIIIDAGFARLPRRDRRLKDEVVSGTAPRLQAPIAGRLNPGADAFSSQMAGLLCMLPYIVTYGIDKAIEQSNYPGTRDISRLSSILAFLALKLSNVKRYTADDAWCMDRGMGLFAGLTVLPKAAWFSSYSSAVTRDMNISFLESLQRVWEEHGLLSDTVNLDFTAIPYWGDDDHLENNWSGKRNKALASIQAVLAQDPESGILCYGDTTIRHLWEKNVVLEFLDFYQSGANRNLKYLVFDSKFTVYQNLGVINAKGVKFITIRRKSKSLLERIQTIDPAKWRKIRIQKDNGRYRSLLVYDESYTIKEYNGDVRHVYIKDRDKTNPAVMITNDFQISLESLVRKYARRWLVETDISEHIDFFHLNRNSSSIVIKVDFDLTMSILAHNLYKLFCRDFDGYSHCEAQAVFDKFISAAGHIQVDDGSISIRIKKKRTLPILLENMRLFSKTRYSWLFDYYVNFSADSTT